MRATQMGVTVTKQPFTFFLSAALIYLLMTVVAMIALHFIEKRVNRGFSRSQA
jgi:ABC-type arginine transport system permease subunit